MSELGKDDGVIVALLKRFEEQRLPALLHLKERVEAGETLTDLDIHFLKEVFETANQIKPLLDRHPQYEELAAKATHLYHQVTEKALENEKNG